jgi:hypothetical protein
MSNLIPATQQLQDYLHQVDFSLFETEEDFLEFRRNLISMLMGRDPIIMNVTLTSDIIKYNKLNSNHRCILEGNMIKNVSDKQSFVYNPHN